MVGVINHWDILTHTFVTIRCFEWGVFFRAIRPWQSKSFLAATDSAFVKKLRPFREAMDAHIAYLVERLLELSPNAAGLPRNAVEISWGAATVLMACPVLVSLKFGREEVARRLSMSCSWK